MGAPETNLNAMAPLSTGGHSLVRLRMALWQSLTRRGILGWAFAVIFVGFYVMLYWSYDLDAIIAGRQQETILAPLKKKLAIAQADNLAARHGLEAQLKHVIAGAKEKSTAAAYHTYLLPENRVFVDRLRALHWQYFESMDKVTPHESPFSIKKQVMLTEQSDQGPKLIPLNGTKKLKPGAQVAS